MAGIYRERGVGEKEERRKRRLKLNWSKGGQRMGAGEVKE
jgi:hypothetical protein